MTVLHMTVWTGTLRTGGSGLLLLKDGVTFYNTVFNDDELDDATVVCLVVQHLI